MLGGGHGESRGEAAALAVPVGQQEVATASGGCRPARRSAAAPARGRRRGRPVCSSSSTTTGWACRRPAARRGSRTAISATALTPSGEPRKPTLPGCDRHVLEDAARLLGDRRRRRTRDGRRPRRCRACTMPVTTGSACAPIAAIVATSPARPPAPLGSLALNTITQAGAAARQRRRLGVGGGCRSWEWHCSHGPESSRGLGAL